MAKKSTPLKDEPLAQFDDVCTKVDALVDVINRQNDFLQQIAKDGGYNTEYKFLCNEFNVRQTLENALDEYLEKNRKKIVSVDEEDTKLTKAKTLLEEYRTSLKDAVDAAGKDHSDETPPTTVVIHEAAPSYIDVPQHPEAPNTYKGLLAYLFFRMPWYHVRKFFSSRYVRWTYRTILFSVWLISICLTCIIAHDNVQLHTIQKKYVLLREFARPNQEWADKADYIEFLYTDEAENQEEIQMLWANRRKRLERQ